MPHRKIVAEEMSAFLAALSHPDRLRIALELQSGEREVSSLRQDLGISPSRLSQHLGLLKTHHIVGERKVGRKVLYHLQDPSLGSWLMQGMGFLKQEQQRVGGLMEALQQATQTWDASSS